TRDTLPPAPPSGVVVIETPNGIEIIGAPGSVDPFTEVEVMYLGELGDREYNGLEAILEFMRRIAGTRADANGEFLVVINDPGLDRSLIRIRCIDPAGNVWDLLPLPAPQPDRRDPPVGRLPGEFSVDPTGAANYRIPI